MNIIEILPYGSNVDRYQVNLGQENLNQVNLESGQCQVDWSQINPVKLTREPTSV